MTRASPVNRAHVNSPLIQLVVANLNLKGSTLFVTSCMLIKLSSLKFVIAFERRMRKNTQFYTHGR